MLFLNRREFLKLTLASSAAMPFTKLLQPTFSFAEGAGSGKNLILINMAGGLDPLSAFPYYLDPNVTNQSLGFVQFLRSVRPNTFMLPQDNLNDPTPQYLANSYMGFAPGWKELVNSWRNNIKLIQRIGIRPSEFADGSHNYCENCFSFGTEQFSGGLNRAWFARVIEAMNLTQNQAFSFGTLGRVDFATGDPALAPIAGMSTNSLTWSDSLSNNRRAVNLEAAKQFLEASSANTIAEKKIKSSLDKAIGVSDLMDEINSATVTGGPKALAGVYPNLPGLPIGSTLKSVARVVRFFEGDNKDRIFYAYQGGLDHHSDEGGYNSAGNPTGLLHTTISETAKSLKALIADLNAASAWNKTVIILFSEMGRAARENGGLGTDHGNGTTFMVLGGPVSAGVIGEAPRLIELQDRNMYSPTIGFQNLFAAAVKWFGCDDNLIFPHGSYQRDESVVNSIIT